MYGIASRFKIIQFQILRIPIFFIRIPLQFFSDQKEIYIFFSFRQKMENEIGLQPIYLRNNQPSSFPFENIWKISNISKALGRQNHPRTYPIAVGWWGRTKMKEEKQILFLTHFSIFEFNT